MEKVWRIRRVRWKKFGEFREFGGKSLENSRFIGVQLTICSVSRLVGLGMPRRNPARKCRQPQQQQQARAVSFNYIMETLGWDIAVAVEACLPVQEITFFCTASTSKAGLVKARDKEPPAKSCRPGGKPLVYSNCKSSNGTTIYAESFHNSIWLAIALHLNWQLNASLRLKFDAATPFQIARGKKYILVYSLT